MQFCHEVKLRVRYNETGHMGIAHHAAYLSWFDLAQLDFLRKHGLSYFEQESRGLHFPQIETHIKYKEPARLEDELTVRMGIVEAGQIKMVIRYEIRRDSDGALIATGETVQVFVDDSYRPRSMKKIWPEGYQILQDILNQQ